MSTEAIFQEAKEISRMRRATLCAAQVLFISCAAFAQTTGATPSFEVASIKPAAPPSATMGPGGGNRMVFRTGSSGGPGSSDPGQINYFSMSMKSLLVSAYGVKSYQISGPSWLDTERFDIVAKIPKGATKDDLKLMLQNLLAERFKLTLHHEKKDLPMYALVVGKGGPKMKESPEDPAPKEEAKDAAKDAFGPHDAGAATDAAAQKAQTAFQPMRLTMGADGMPKLPPGNGRPGNMMMMMPGRMRMMATKQTMPAFADSLGNQMDRAVVDMTGLTKNYDFTLDFAPEDGMVRGMPGMPPPPPGDGGGGGDHMAMSDGQAAPSLFTALQEQLGLKLEQKKGPVDLLVIDRLEKTPTEN
jgi:uncharacterized protein (TIGR03435 family)